MKGRFAAWCVAALGLAGCSTIDINRYAVAPTEAKLPWRIACAPSEETPSWPPYWRPPAPVGDAPPGPSIPAELQNSKVGNLIAHTANPNETIRPTSLLTTDDFASFSKLIAKHILRIERKSPPLEERQFWSDVRKYYNAYYQGKYVDYFGVKYPKPSLATTINDAELANAAAILVDYIFDRAARTPVWIDVPAPKGGAPPRPAGQAFPDGTIFYPGGDVFEPTLLTVYPALGLPIKDPADESSVACGMTIPKAETLGLVARGAAGASASAVGLGLSSWGGVDINFIVVGTKFNIGDNKALTTLIQATVYELVARSSVQLAYPFLSRYRFPAGVTPNDLSAVIQARNTRGSGP
jgi:hypothetical protein